MNLMTYVIWTMSWSNMVIIGGRLARAAVLFEKKKRRGRTPDKPEWLRPAIERIEQ